MLQGVRRKQDIPWKILRGCEFNQANESLAYEKMLTDSTHDEDPTLSGSALVFKSVHGCNRN